MSGTQIGFLMFGILMALLVVRIPIGIAMFSVGCGGYFYLTGGDITPVLAALKNTAYARLSNYDLVVIPLFLLMGQFATHGGLSSALFRCVSAFTEKVFFHLACQVLASTRVGQVQAVFIQQHGLVLEPGRPGFLAHAFKNAFTQLAGVGRKVQAFGLFAQLDAVNGAWHVDILGEFCIGVLVINN